MQSDLPQKRKEEKRPCGKACVANACLADGGQGGKVCRQRHKQGGDSRGPCKKAPLQALRMYTGLRARLPTWAFANNSPAMEEICQAKSSQEIHCVLHMKTAPAEARSSPPAGGIGLWRAFASPPSRARLGSYRTSKSSRLVLDVSSYKGFDPTIREVQFHSNCSLRHARGGTSTSKETRLHSKHLGRNSSKIGLKCRRLAVHRGAFQMNPEDREL